MKTANIGREILHIFWDFNGIFRKHLTYDNIKSHKKPRFHYILRRYVFFKKKNPAVLGLKDLEELK